MESHWRSSEHESLFEIQFKLICVRSESLQHTLSILSLVEKLFLAEKWLN